MDKTKSKTHIDVQNIQIPSYGIIESENCGSVAITNKKMDIPLDSIFNDISTANGNCNALTNSSLTQSITSSG